MSPTHEETLVKTTAAWPSWLDRTYRSSSNRPRLASTLTSPACRGSQMYGGTAPRYSGSWWWSRGEGAGVGPTPRSTVCFTAVVLPRAAGELRRAGAAAVLPSAYDGPENRRNYRSTFGFATLIYATV